MTIQKQAVTFPSRGNSCAGDLYLDPSRDTMPAVALAHGLGAVKQMYLEPFAQALAQTGIAALVFDYRFFGASGGNPRHQVLPHEQLEDYRSALTWLSLDPRIDADRLGVWGTSFSGGHVLHPGAYDARVKVVVSQVGAMDLFENVRRTMSFDAARRLLAVAAEERLRAATRGGTAYIRNAAHPGGDAALQVDAETHDWLEHARKTVAPSWVNEISCNSIEAIIEYSPASAIERVSPKPLLMLLATEDKWTPASLIREAFSRAREPKKLVEIEGGHYAVYHGEIGKRAATLAADWFANHL